MAMRLEEDWLGMEGDGKDELAARYREFPDLRLMELAEVQADLTESARTALRAEFARRGLAWPEMEKEPVAARFGQMSNGRLLEVAREYERLSEGEQAGLRGEFAARGLEAPLIEEDEPEGGEEEPAAVGATDEAGQWVTVRSYRDLPEAIVARSMLEQAEIPCFLRDEHTVGIYWGYSNLIGGVKLQVPAAFVEAAEAALAQPVPAEFATDTGEYVQPVCPKCGSLNVMADDLDRKLKLTGTLVSGLPMIVCLPTLAMMKKGAWKCLNCECRWVDDGDAVAESTVG
jgi:hypothetical protein